MTKTGTFSSFLHIRAIIGSRQHRHGVAAVLCGETVLEGPWHRVIKHVEGKLKKQGSTRLIKLCLLLQVQMQKLQERQTIKDSSKNRKNKEYRGIIHSIVGITGKT